MLHERVLGKYAARETHVKHVDRVKRIRETGGKFLTYSACRDTGEMPRHSHYAEGMSLVSVA